MVHSRRPRDCPVLWLSPLENQEHPRRSLSFSRVPRLSVCRRDRGISSNSLIILPVWNSHDTLRTVTYCTACMDLGLSAAYLHMRCLLLALLLLLRLCSHFLFQTIAKFVDANIFWKLRQSHALHALQHNASTPYATPDSIDQTLKLCCLHEYH